MPIIRCPHCDDRVEIEDDWYGRRIACPSCDKSFTPQPEGGSPRRTADDDDDRPRGRSRYARNEDDRDDRPPPRSRSRSRSYDDPPPKKGNAVLWVILILVGVFVVLPCVSCVGFIIYANTVKETFAGPWSDQSLTPVAGGPPAVTASFPKTPVSRSLTDAANGGSGSTLGYHNMDQGDGLADAIFVIGHVDYPAGTVNPLDRGYLEIRRQVEEGYMDNPLVPPTVASERSTTVSGYPAKETTYSDEDGRYTLRVIHVNNRPAGQPVRLVVVAAGGTGMKEEDKQKFLNSVKFGK